MGGVVDCYFQGEKVDHVKDVKVKISVDTADRNLTGNFLRWSIGTGVAIPADGACVRWQFQH